MQIMRKSYLPSPPQDKVNSFATLSYALWPSSNVDRLYLTTVDNDISGDMFHSHDIHVDYNVNCDVNCNVDFDFIYHFCTPNNKRGYIMNKIKEQSTTVVSSPKEMITEPHSPDDWLDNLMYTDTSSCNIDMIDNRIKGVVTTH